jgi:hypothetical protein
MTIKHNYDRQCKCFDCCQRENILWDKTYEDERRYRKKLISETEEQEKLSKQK